MPYATGFPPHIRSSEAVPKIFWKINASLFSVAVVSVYFSGFLILRSLALSITAALFAEITARSLFKEKQTPYDGSSVLTGLLLALMLPSNLASGMIVLGSFFAVFFGKETFGRLGANPFHPAVVGNVFLQVCFPNAFSGPGAPQMLISLALVLGGVILIWQKLIYWEIPLIYIAVFFILALPLGFSPEMIVLKNPIFLSAFFLITDSVTTPLTRQGIRLFAAGSALLGFLLQLGSIYPYGIYFAILLMNALTPWIDGWIKPGMIRNRGR